MMEAANLMNNLIENKLSLSAFNTDDEINLSEFLTLVNSERQFSKQYREKASSWLEEICKPSRRFKKTGLDDLEIRKPSGLKKTMPTRSGNPEEVYESGREEEEDE